jgi:hypothetical protein
MAGSLDMWCDSRFTHSTRSPRATLCLCCTASHSAANDSRSFATLPSACMARLICGMCVCVCVYACMVLFIICMYVSVHHSLVYVLRDLVRSHATVRCLSVGGMYARVYFVSCFYGTWFCTEKLGMRFCVFSCEQFSHIQFRVGIIHRYIALMYVCANFIAKYYL